MSLSAAQYHQKTSYFRLRMDGQALDWPAQPNVYKTYPGPEPVRLSREPRLPEKSLADLLQQEPEANPQSKITADDLSALFRLTYSLTAKARHPGGDFFYRSAASAGALYPTEIYAALTGIDGLEDGLYHFSIAHHGLIRIRSGAGPPFWGTDRSEPSAVGPGLVFFLTAIFFRSSWKYRDRAFRYHLLDTGHVLEHLVLALKALSLPYRLTFDFEDRGIGRLLGLDEKQEVPLALCLVNTPEVLSDFTAVPGLEPLSPAFQQAGRVSGREVDYPLIREAYQAGGAPKREGPAGFDLARRLGPEPSSWVRLSDPVQAKEKTTLAQAIFSRRSRRNYVAVSLPRESWQALWAALAWSEEQEQPLGVQPHQVLSIGCLADRVEGIPPGFYLLEWRSKSIGLGASGSFTRPMAGVCLDQAWLAQAPVHFCFLTNLRLLDDQWGPRGYRYALMQAGRLGERLYLTATTLGLGCCGIGAFYDQEAADLLGLNHDSRLLYLVAVGPVKSVK
ncbi:MAG: SagB/ThcOx family dehydrogenase [Deltaproteobacteria bacterium]|nr:SagB/ThcOx family dehydrogenase [Deltaproteobacteria bacterium]